jgi:proteasome accessory factor A
VLEHQVDWIAKRKLVESYRARQGLSLAHPRIALMDLAYHDVNRSRGLYYILERRGLAERMCDEIDIDRATKEPPQTTRAKLRGEFIQAAKRKRRDFTVDWVHLKLNDQAQRTVLCKDPFRFTDERVSKLIASL